LFGAIGLAHYAETFRADDIDGELLGRLTSDDLNEIGVASFCRPSPASVTACTNA
jgi:SAM domain (Sterile alpha motif)